MDTVTRNNNTYDKLVNSCSEISLRFLKEHGLATKEVLIDLFNSDIDTITYEEALSVAKSKNERRKVWLRRKILITEYNMPDINEFMPSVLLSSVDQYHEILMMRDIGISLSAIMKEMCISKATMYRIIKEKNIAILKNNRIARKDYELIKDERNISVAEVAKHLNIRRQQVYRPTKEAGISVKRGYLSNNDFQKIINIHKCRSLNKETLIAILIKNTPVELS